MTDDTLPDEVNCSSQPTIAPPETTITTNTFVIPVVSAVTGSVLLVVIIVVLVLVAKRMCKYSSSPNGEDREQLLPSLTEDPGYGEYMHFFTGYVCIMHNLCVHACLLDAAISNQMWTTESGMEVIKGCGS